MTAEQKEVPGRGKEELEAECREVAEKEGVLLSFSGFIQFVKSFQDLCEVDHPGSMCLEALGGWERTSFGYNSRRTNPLTREFSEEAWVYYEDTKNDSPRGEAIRVADGDNCSFGTHSIRFLSETGRDAVRLTEHLDPLKTHRLLRNVCCGLWELYQKRAYLSPDTKE